MILFDDDLSAVFESFFHRPICIGLMILMAVSVTAPFVLESRRGKK